MTLLQLFVLPELVAVDRSQGNDHRDKTERRTDPTRAKRALRRNYKSSTFLHSSNERIRANLSIDLQYLLACNSDKKLHKTYTLQRPCTTGLWLLDSITVSLLALVVVGMTEDIVRRTVQDKLKEVFTFLTWPWRRLVLAGHRIRIWEIELCVHSHKPGGLITKLYSFGTAAMPVPGHCESRAAINIASFPNRCPRFDVIEDLVINSSIPNKSLFCLHFILILSKNFPHKNRPLAIENWHETGFSVFPRTYPDSYCITQRSGCYQYSGIQPACSQSIMPVIFRCRSTRILQGWRSLCVNTMECDFPCAVEMSFRTPSSSWGGISRN